MGDGGVDDNGMDDRALDGRAPDGRTMDDRGQDVVERGDPAEAFRRLDARDGHVEDEGTSDEPDEDRRGNWTRLRRQLMWLVIAAAAMLLVGFGAGWLFGQTASPSAARLVLGERVETEPDVTAGGEPQPGADTAPTSGETDAEPLCGARRRPVAPARQVATLEAGGVVIQYRPAGLSTEEIIELEGLTDEEDSHILVAPNPSLEAPVEATAWRNRLRLERVEDATLRAFIDGYRLPDPAGGACPNHGPG